MLEQDRLFNDEINLTSIESHGDDELANVTNVLNKQNSDLT